MSLTKRTNIRNRIRYGNNWYGKHGEKRKIVKILLGNQSGKCNVCKLEMWGRETLDHILPLASGGKHEIDNMQLLCNDCHIKKDKELMDYHGSLKIRTW